MLHLTPLSPTFHLTSTFACSYLHQCMARQCRSQRDQALGTEIIARLGVAVHDVQTAVHVIVERLPAAVSIEALHARQAARQPLVLVGAARWQERREGQQGRQRAPRRGLHRATGCLRLDTGSGGLTVNLRVRREKKRGQG